MPHATEGELHAHIDGALATVDPEAAERLVVHLETCADCRARLDEAKSIRDRSAALLEGALGTVGEPPPFDGVVREAEERAEATGSPSSGGWRARGARRLAWAASIAVALGAGWMANAVMRSTDSALLAPGAVEPQTAASPGVGSDNEGAPGDADLAPVGDVSARRELAAALPRESDELSEANRPGRARGQASTPEEGSIADRVDEVAVGERAPADAPLFEAQRRAEPEAPAVEPAVANAALVDAAQASKAVTEDLVVAGYADAELEQFAEDGWVVTDLDAAAAWLGAEVRRVPDLDILDVSVQRVDGRRLARLRQRLPGGETLAVLQEGPAAADDRQTGEARIAQERATDPASRDEAAPTGPTSAAETEATVPVLSSIWVDANGIRVRILAPVAADSLAALLLRVR